MRAETLAKFHDVNALYIYRNMNFSEESLRAWLDEFFYSKSGDFYRGIENLVECEEEAVKSNGE